MVELSPFRIEQYYARYEFTTRFMLSSSDCESRTIGELLALEPHAHERLLEQRCGYTESPGAAELRDAIADLYEGIDLDEVLVTSCAEEGIFLLYHALLGSGDHAIVETPCYESALEVARSTGAEVSEWRRRYEDGWVHDLGTLERSGFARQHLQELRPSGPADRLVGNARRRAAQGAAGSQALHHHLCERAERAPDCDRPPKSLRAVGDQPSNRREQPPVD